MMLTLKDCMGLCELGEEEVLAIAEHEHLPEIVALEMGEHLCQLPTGLQQIKNMIEEDINHALLHNKATEAACWRRLLQQFDSNHPEFRPAT